MTELEAIKERFSVRKYIERPLADNIVEALKEKITECNEKGSLHIQLILNEPKAFNGIMAYGSFSGVSNYLVMAGRKDSTLDERIGYHGEQLVLLAQQLGLGSCWVGLTYNKVKETYTLNNGEKVVCLIALGYHNATRRNHHRKSIEDVSNANATTPAWFRNGVEAALMAPTAVNQQKFYFEYIANATYKPYVIAKRRFSLVGYTRIDLGIAKLHFEIGAGKEHFEWQE